jgi:hypothetical protein
MNFSLFVGCGLWYSSSGDERMSKKKNFLQKAIEKYYWKKGIPVIFPKKKMSANVGSDEEITGVQKSLFEEEPNLGSASAEHALSVGRAQKNIFFERRFAK